MMMTMMRGVSVSFGGAVGVRRPVPGTPGVRSGGRYAARTAGASATPRRPLARASSQGRRASWRVGVATPNSSVDMDVDVDTALENELKENGFRSTRRTKLVCTIGPATSGYRELEQLAQNGMNVARLNMCHGSHEWHREVIQRIRKLNQELGYSLAIMVDTEGSEVHIGDIAEPSRVDMDDRWTFTIRSLDAESVGPGPSDHPEDGAGEPGGQPEAKRPRIASVSYDGFSEDVSVGDEILVDGGMVNFRVVSLQGPDVICECIEPGILLPKANLTFRRDGVPVRARNSMLPTISAKDWLDIDFAIENEVDLIAISFVKTADTVKHLRSYLTSKCMPKQDGPGAGTRAAPGVVSKIESSDSLRNLDDIVAASDAVMVARGDLGSQIPLEDVPVVQQQITTACRRLNKPCIVASHLLRSMLEHPTPTRAEVADIADVVQQRADALMLSGESAAGLHPMKSLEVLRAVAVRTEQQQSMLGASSGGDGTEQEQISEGICSSAANLAEQLGAAAIFVYTKRGYMASLVSRCRPSCPIFAFTDTNAVRRKMNLLWGIIPFGLPLDANPEKTVERTFKLLRARDLIKEGQLVVVVSDVGPTADVIRSIQVRYVTKDGSL